MPIARALTQSLVRRFLKRSRSRKGRRLVLRRVGKERMHAHAAIPAALACFSSFSIFAMADFRRRIASLPLLIAPFNCHLSESTSAFESLDFFQRCTKAIVRIKIFAMLSLSAIASCAPLAISCMRSRKLALSARILADSSSLKSFASAVFGFSLRSRRFDRFRGGQHCLAVTAPANFLCRRTAWLP